VLKLSFDTTIPNPVVTAAAPYGSVVRKNDGMEMPMGEWLDLSGQDAGLSILTGSLFSYDATGPIASLTVLRSAIFGDLRLPEGLDPAVEYVYLGQGVTEGRWALHFHNGDWRRARIPQLAMQFCNPPVAVIEANHPGSLPQERSFASIDGQSTVLTALKQAEDGNGLIARAYEYAGKDDHLVVVLAGQQKTTTIKAFEIKTIRIDQQEWAESDVLESSGEVCSE
jgi:alpha-mannosidase